MNWVSEDIPSHHKVFCRVHKNNVDVTEKRPRSIAFYNSPKQSKSLSSDWEHYSTPAETRNRAKTFEKKPEDYFVVSLVKGEVETKIEGQEIKHTPDIVNNNRAHSDIFGEKDDEARLKYLDLYRWEISPIFNQ